MKRRGRNREEDEGRNEEVEGKRRKEMGERLECMNLYICPGRKGMDGSKAWEERGKRK